MLQLQQRLMQDHEQIERLLLRNCVLLETSQLEPARDFCMMFQVQLLHHIQLEDQQLLPLFQPRSQEFAQRLGEEHRWLKREVAALQESLEPPMVERLRKLKAFLQMHSHSEEDRLYAFAQQLGREGLARESELD